VAADSGLVAAETAGITPHWVIGDMDSLDDCRRLEKYPPRRVIRYPQDKDYTDTELALGLLWDQGCDETWLVGGGGGRMDHLLAIRSLFEREPNPDRWLTRGDDIRCVRPGDLLTFRGEAKKMPLSPVFPPQSFPEYRVSVFPVGAGPWKAESRGLKWPLDGLAWDRGFFGVGNIALQGFFTLKSIRGRFMVVLSEGV
jgi:thiamine pyrophosphokinase